MKKLGRVAMMAAVCAVFIGILPAQAEQPCKETDLTLGRSCGFYVPLRSLPLHFEYNPAGAPANLSQKRVTGTTLAREAIENAITTWNGLWPLKSDDPACPALCYSGTTTRHAGVRDGHNVIEFVDDFSICGGSTEAGLACAWYEATSGPGAYRIKEVDIFLSPALEWAQPGITSDPTQAAQLISGEVLGITGGTGGWIDLQSVLTHEFGHGLGLEHPNAANNYPRTFSEFPYAIQTMYGGAVLESTTNKRSPEAGDIAALAWTASLSQSDS